MIRFFKSPQPATLVIIPLIIVILWARIFLHSMPVTDHLSLPLWGALFSFFNAMPNWLNFIFLIAFISGEALYLNIMLNRHEVLYKNSFLPALIFALFISSTPGLMQFHPIHIVNLLVIRIFDRAFTLFKNEMTLRALFDTSFLCGVTALIYFPYIVMFPFLVSMVIVLLPFRLKEWLIMFTGFFLPLFFIGTWLFWNHSLVTYWHMYEMLFKNLQPKLFIDPDPKLITLAICMGLLLLFSLFKLRLNYRKNVIRTRIYQQVLFFFLLAGGLFIVLCNKISIIHFGVLMIPISVFSAYYFLSTKRRLWIYETVLWGIVAVILWNHLG